MDGLGIQPGGVVDRYLQVDQNFYLPDDILYKTDRMSMAHSLEVRPPFLDPRIVDFAAALPQRLKIRGFKQKFILKELMRGKLPEAVLNRKKTGFDIPTHDWFRGILRPLLMDTLTTDAIEATGIFDAHAIHSMIRDHMERRINVGYHLWGLLTLFLWMKRWKVEILPPVETAAEAAGTGLRYQVIVLVVAALVFFGCMVSPPSLMDDVDAVQAQIAHNMLQSGDWVTARLDGVAYLEKSPLKYWMIAVSFMIFGVHDWAARIPIALGTVLLCWVTARFGAWAFGRRAGMYAGLVLATSIGLFLFTRILIPDAILTLTITLTLWGLLRALEESEPHPTRWAMAMWAAMATGLLLKGLIAALFPVAAGAAVSGRDAATAGCGGRGRG